MDLFSKAYWALVADKVVGGAAAGALAVLTTGHIAGSAPWYAVLTGAGVGALTSLCKSLASEAAPNTMPTTFIPRALVTPAKKRAPAKGAREVRRPVATPHPAPKPPKPRT